MRIWEKAPGLTSYFLIFLFFSSSPSHSTFPCPFFFSLTSFLPPLDKNYTRIHSPELALVTYYETDPKVSQFFCIAPPPVHFLFFLSPHFSFGSSFLFVHFFFFLSCFPFLSPFLSSSLSSSLSLPSFSLFFDFYPGPKTLWFFPPLGRGKGDNTRIIIHPCKDVWILLMSVLKGFTMKLEKKSTRSYQFVSVASLRTSDEASNTESSNFNEAGRQKFKQVTILRALWFSEYFSSVNLDCITDRPTN